MEVEEATSFTKELAILLQDPGNFYNNIIEKSGELSAS